MLIRQAREGSSAPSTNEPLDLLVAAGELRRKKRKVHRHTRAVEVPEGSSILA